MRTIMINTTTKNDAYFYANGSIEFQMAFNGYEPTTYSEETIEFLEQKDASLPEYNKYGSLDTVHAYYILMANAMKVINAWGNEDYDTIQSLFTELNTRIDGNVAICQTDIQHSIAIYMQDEKDGCGSKAVNVSLVLDSMMNSAREFEHYIA